jgi:dihydrodipicolinate reductase
MARIGIIGCEGAMGHALAAVIGASGHELAGGIDKGGDAAGLADASEVLVDFSTPGALCINLHAAIGAGVPLVIGTTGLEERHHAAIDDAARAVPVLQTGNTSLGVTLLAHLVREAAARLGPDWDIEILEMHHRRKVDAPSGTALLLGEAAAGARGIDLASHSERGRDARRRRDRLCQPARRHRGGRTQRDPGGRGRTHHAVAQRRESLDLRARRGARGRMDDRARSRPLLDGPGAGDLSL